MSRKGRDLENLIAFLEKNLGPQGIKVTSPDFIDGKISKSKREIDVSLWSQIGSSEILVIMECRDRLGSEDVTWIEQIASKQRDIGADKAVAVSSAGFTSGAINTAKTHNIELRTFSEISIDDILLWFDCKEFNFYKRFYNIVHYNIQLARQNNIDTRLSPELIAKLSPTVDTKALIFRKKKDGQLISLEDLWHRLSPEKIFSNVLPGEPKIRRRIHITFPENEEYQFLTLPEPTDIEYVDIDTELWIEIEKKPLKTVRFYKDEGEIIAKSAEFEGFEHMGKTHVLGFHQIPKTGEQIISVRLEVVPYKDKKEER